MPILVSLLAFTTVAVLMGKWAKRKGTGWYVAVIILTVLQVAVVSYQLFIMRSPVS